MSHPLFFLTCAFSLGIASAGRLRPPFLCLYVATVILLFFSIFFFREGRKPHSLLLLLCFLSGALLLVNSRTQAANHLLKIVPYGAREVTLEGVVISSPQVKSQRASFVLNCGRLKANHYWHNASGRVLVRLPAAKKVFYADRLLLEGRLRRPFYYLGRPGGRNPAAYLENRGIYFILNVKKGRPVKKINSRSKANPLVYFAYRTREGLREISARNLPPLSASVLNALILGLRQELPKDTARALINTGTAHIVAISGLHIGIFLFIVLIFLKALRLPKITRYCAAIIILWGYCLLTGASLPAVRAAIMATIFLAGLIIRRQPDIAGSLSLAALLILSAKPAQLFEASFQLSFLSIISLVVITPKIQAFFYRRIKKQKGLRPLVNIFSASLGAWLGLSPLILYYFRVISPVAILGNMVIVPYLALLVACGLSFFLAGVFFPVLLPVFSPAAELAVLLLLKFVSLLAKVPFGYFRLA